MRRDCKISALSSLFGHPVVAAALGALLGVLLMAVSHWAVTFVTPEDPTRGVLIVGMMMFARFAIALSALAAYYFLVPSGLAPFGVLLAASFVTGLFVEAVRLSRPSMPHTST